MAIERPNAITKVLSKNDTGETGSHQVGILVPKEPSILSFFPELDTSVKNPRCLLNMVDPIGGKWTFSFIYYNNSFFGGTRNEYRLTRTTAFFRSHSLREGDELTLTRCGTERYSISYRRRRDNGGVGPRGKLKLGTVWRVIRI